MSIVMDSLFEAQQSLQHKISGSYANFRAKGKEKMTHGNAVFRLKSLEDNFQSFSTNHKKITNSEDFR